MPILTILTKWLEISLYMRKFPVPTYYSKSPNKLRD
nr:MAG TPA: hypothetical protein [Caudoviricetes sp.]